MFMVLILSCLSATTVLAGLAPAANMQSYGPTQNNTLAGGFVTCGKVGANGLDSNGKTAAQSCGFSDLINMINTIITYLIYIAMPLAAISFAYAGWLYLSAGDKPANISKAKTIFIDVGIGIFLVIASWLIFKLIETTFLNTGAGYSTYLN